MSSSAYNKDTANLLQRGAHKVAKRTKEYTQKSVDAVDKLVTRVTNLVGDKEPEEVAVPAAPEARAAARPTGRRPARRGGRA